MKAFMLCCLLFLGGSSLFAQQAPMARTVQTGSYMTALEGIKPGYYMLLNGMDRSTAEKKWQELMKSYGGKTAKIKKTDQYLTPGVTIREVSNAPVDVLAQFQKKGDDTEMYMWIRNADGYLQPGGNEGLGVTGGFAVTKGYDVMITRYMIEEDIKAQEKGLDKLDRDYRSLVKEKENLEDDIRTYEKRIIDARAKIESNVSNQQKKTEEVAAARKKLDQTKDQLNRVN